ncbi:hypothetical protein PDE_02261 [Penicillium oxalicum 114-2]|uniref:Uncharacterized protein n=1 Tax=Penicillium oxalicum (strain 114-2 / CGMCC 5302) TaxID=933388 RepID=S8AN41_PENO1|nr:hypothetical protein PDE_02261 [Penicillium oxalicum 114-2]
MPVENPIAAESGHLLTVLDCVDCTYAHQSIEIYLMVRRKLVRIGPRSLSREAPDYPSNGKAHRSFKHAANAPSIPSSP